MMRVVTFRASFALAGLFLSALPASAQMLGTSARQMSAGSWKVLAYYQGVQDQDLSFSLTGDGTCAGGAAAPASNVSFPCGTTGKVSGEGSGGAAILKVIHQPWENLQYYATVGVGDYSLRVASVSTVNSLTGDSPGLLYSFGARALLWPDTEVPGVLVVPALAVDASVGWQQYRFNGMQPARTAAENQINQRLDLLQTQVALETSHRFKFDGTRWALEPYGGLKWLRTQAWLKDLKDGGRVGGIKDTAAPFVGIEVPLHEKESLFAEASFVNGVQYAAGLNLRFK